MTWAEEVAEAVQYPWWQDFRADLKGASTYAKLYWLKGWYEGLEVEAATLPDRMRYVQVINYLFALARGGIIKMKSHPSEWIDSFIEWDKQIEVLK